MPIKWSAFYIDEDIIFSDGKRADEFPTSRLASLDVFLMSMATKFSEQLDGGTVLLSEASAKLLGFPSNPPKGKNAKTHPVLDSARNVGWEISGVGPWMTFHRRRFDCPSVHVGVLPWLNERTFCFIDEPFRDGIVMTGHLRMFSHLIGISYRMRPGVTANASLMHMWQGKKPFWSPSWDGVQPAQFEREKRYQWRTPSLPGDGFEHGWDIRQQYLAAANVSRVALNNLVHTGRKRFDSSPGYWLITVPAWNVKQCPHPAGNYVGGEQAWVTTPTMSYLHELSGRYSGVVSEPEIHDSWTAIQSHRMFRTWTERIRDGIVLAAERANPCVSTALKDAYKASIGLWQTPTGFIHRPDWADTVAANARVNLHRKVWAEGRRRGGQWPTRINYDCVYYHSQEDNSEAAIPAGFCDRNEAGELVLSPLMGKFKYEKTISAGADLMDSEGNSE